MAYRAAYAAGAGFSFAGLLLILVSLFESAEHPLFFGEMWLPRGTPTRLVVRPVSPEFEHHEGDGLNVVRVAGLDLVPYYPEIPPRLLDLQQAYEASETPFALTLRDVHFEEGVSEPARLRVTEEGRERFEPVLTGARVVLDGQEGIMREIRPWGGILREPSESGGTPLAVVAVRSTEHVWSEDIVAQQGDWLALAEDLVFCFRWSDSEDAAARSMAAELPGLESARWGVEEGGVVNWFDTFLPGAGLQLGDGTVVVLAEVREEHPERPERGAAIRLRVARPDETLDMWVPANATSDDGMLRFEYPTLARFVLLGYSWEPGMMTLQLYESGTEAARVTVEAGEIAPLDGADVEFRLDQALGSAVYLRREDSPLEELIIESPGRVLRLRHGETVLLGGQAIEFHAAMTERRVLYVVGVEEAGRERMLSLRGDDTVRVGHWTFEHAADAGQSEAWATLYAERLHVSRAAQWGRHLLMAGVVCLVGGVLIRIGGRGRRGAES